MAITFQFYRDAALTDPLDPERLTFDFLDDGTTGAVDAVLYFGSATAGRRAQSDSNPGVDPITVSVIDAATGSGQPASAVKLALTSAGLATATAGAALSLGVATVNSGAAGAVAVYLRVQDATSTVGNYDDLSIQTNVLRETAV